MLLPFATKPTSKETVILIPRIQACPGVSFAKIMQEI
jgi:hypothetical protein